MKQPLHRMIMRVSTNAGGILSDEANDPPVTTTAQRMPSPHRPDDWTSLAVLVKSNIVCILAETASTHIEPVLANDANARSAHSALAGTFPVALGM